MNTLVERPKSLWGKEPFILEQARLSSATFDFSRAGYLIAHERMSPMEFPTEKELVGEIFAELQRTKFQPISLEFKRTLAKKYLSRGIDKLKSIGI